MDFFNTKALAASESRCAALERELNTRNEDVAMFKYALRSMDDVVMKLAQSANPDNTHPDIAKLIGALNQLTEHRRQSESGRINSIIHSELNKAF